MYLVCDATCSALSHLYNDFGTGTLVQSDVTDLSLQKLQPMCSKYSIAETAGANLQLHEASIAQLATKIQLVHI